MKKLARILLLATVVSATYVYADEDPVVAKYKDGEIKASQIFEAIKPRLQMDPNFKDKTFADLDKNSQEAIIKQFAVAKLLEQDSKTSGIENTKEFQAKLETAKNNILQAEYIEQNVKKLVTDDMIKQKTEELKKSVEGQNEIKVSHILVETENQAKDVKAQLDSKKAKFEDLAKKLSKDQGSKANGGKIANYIRRGAGNPPVFEEKAFALSKGQISDPVKTDYGWHILKVEDIRPIQMKEDEIKQQATQMANANAVNKIIDDLTKKYDLKIITLEQKAPAKAEEKKEIKHESKPDAHVESKDVKTEVKVDTKEAKPENKDAKK